MSKREIDRDRAIECPSAIPGLSFRPFAGDADYEPMLAVIEASKREDHDEWSPCLDDIARTYRHLVHCDPRRDMLMAQIDGQMIGYGRVWWEDEHDGDRVYNFFINLVPSWRGKGVRLALLHWLERRARALSDENPSSRAETLQTGGTEYERDSQRVLEAEGYRIVRWEYHMVRSLDEAIPPASLPPGIELRPATDAQAEAIYVAASEAFVDHWGVTDWFSAESLAEWRESPTYDPSLWAIAWDGDQIVGMVLNYADARENAEYGRKRGYTETICVRRPWRGRGIARALITHSLQMWKARGMTEASHGVDTQNPSGALPLYESLGYRPRKTYFTYRKPLHTDRVP